MQSAIESNLLINWDVDADGSPGEHGQHALQVLANLLETAPPICAAATFGDAISHLGLSGGQEIDGLVRRRKPIDLILTGLSANNRNLLRFRMMGAPCLASGDDYAGCSGVVVEDVDAVKQLEILESIRTDVGRKIGQDYLDSLVRSVGERLNARTVYIGRVSGDLKRVKIEAIYLNGDSVLDHAFEATNLPCEEVIRTQELQMIPKDASTGYPRLTEFMGLPVSGYVGSPLFNNSGELFAILSIQTCCPIVEMDLFRLIVNIYADRVEAELLRQDVEQHLDAIRDNLEFMVAERTQRIERMQRDVVRTERLATLGRLTGYVSHELRNPLGTIRNSLATISRTLSDEQVWAGKAVRRADRAISRCTAIVEELLSYAKTRELNVERIQFDTWIEDLVADLNAPAGLDLTTSNGCSRIVLADSGYLYQAVSNVLRNAWQAALERHSDGGAKVSLEAACHEDRLDITVSDNGSGISDDVMAQMFDPLFSTKAFGVGLGMSIIQRAVELHGGAVTVENLPDVGTRVRIHIPQPPLKVGG